jgi:hypothetical protein
VQQPAAPNDYALLETLRKTLDERDRLDLAAA